MRILLFSIIIIVFDQVTKLSVRYFFEKGIPHKIIGDFVRLTYIENPGMAFGIQVGGQQFFTVFATIASVIIFIYIVRARNEKFSSRFALSLILGGAIGNLIDRFLFGKVVDFIDIGIKNTRWPIFNVADSSVTIGMIILVAMVFFDKSEKNEKKYQELAVED
ncbi:MAG: signal peptidase II [bacterium]